MESAEVYRNVRPELLHDPARQINQFGIRVVFAGDEKGCEFDPDSRFVLQVLERLENGGERTTADLSIE